MLLEESARWTCTCNGWLAKGSAFPVGIIQPVVAPQEVQFVSGSTSRLTIGSRELPEGGGGGGGLTQIEDTKKKNRNHFDQHFSRRMLLFVVYLRNRNEMKSN